MSLRTRLLASVAAVVLASLAATAIVSNRFAEHEIRRLADEESEQRQRAESAELARRLDAAAPAEWPARVRAWEGSLTALLFSTGDGSLLAVSDPRLATWDLAATDHRLQGVSPDGGHAVELIVPAERVESGAAAAHLFVVPWPGGGEPGSSARPSPRLGWTLGALLVVGSLALLAAWTVVRRLARPLEELTAALRDGDLSRRLPADGDDEVGRLARSFNELAARLQRAERLRRDLVSDVAHELRTPLTNLRCELEALADGLADADPAEIGSLLEEVVHLQCVVADLEELALAEAGALRLEPRTLDVAAELERAVAAAPHRAAVELDLAGDLPAVRADPRRLRQIVANLLDNARRHAPPGTPVTVEARAVGDAVEVRVRDRGPGVPLERRGDVFERFVRLDPSRQRATGGAGLGLAIVEQLVAAQGGTVGVAETPGGGATFWFRLPVDRQARGVTPPRATAIRGSARRRASDGPPGRGAPQ